MRVLYKEGFKMAENHQAEINYKEIFIEQIKKLMNDKHITRDSIAKTLNVSTKTVDGYLSINNKRAISADNLYKLSVAYKVPMDYFYNNKSYISKRDTMVDIISSLDQVFRIRAKKLSATYNTSEPILLIDRQFYNYLNKIEELESCYSNINIFNDKDYIRKREEIQLKYKEYLKSIFNSDSFDENQSVHRIIYRTYNADDKYDNAIDIDSRENISVIDLLAAVPNHPKSQDTE